MSRNQSRPRPRRDQGVALIIVVIILFFMVTVGFALMAVTRTGPSIAGNVRWRQEVLNAAEAGVDAALTVMDQTMSDLSLEWRTTFNGTEGLDDPTSENYYRHLTDKQIVDDVLSQPDRYIFADQPMPDDSRLTYTAFLVNGLPATPSPSGLQAILIVIGRGPDNTYVRFEIEIGQ